MLRGVHIRFVSVVHDRAAGLPADEVERSVAGRLHHPQQVLAHHGENEEDQEEQQGELEREGRPAGRDRAHDQACGDDVDRVQQGDTAECQRDESDQAQRAHRAGEQEIRGLREGLRPHQALYLDVAPDPVVLEGAPTVPAQRLRDRKRPMAIRSFQDVVEHRAAEEPTARHREGQVELVHSRQEPQE